MTTGNNQHSKTALTRSGQKKTPKRSLDGFIVKAKTVKNIQPALAASVKVASSQIKKQVMDIAPRVNASATHLRTQSAKTLMRQSVHKPMAGAKKAFKATHAVAVAPIVIKPSVRNLDAKRLRHAQHVAKSHLIQHFSPLGAQPAPITTMPIVAPNSPAAVRQDDIALPHFNQPSTKTQDLLNRALEKANAHEQLKLPKRRKSRKLLKVSMSILSVLALFAIIGYQEMPNIRVHLASQHAGFAASLPAFQPAGYSLSKIDASTGVVDMKFDSNSDNRSFAITEKASNWDSEALRQAFVTQSVGKDYQTVQAAGRTIYLYGSRTATWVNGGIWYHIEAKDSLSQHQLIDLATSL